MHPRLIFHQALRAVIGTSFHERSCTCAKYLFKKKGAADWGLRGGGEIRGDRVRGRLG